MVIKERTSRPIEFATQRRRSITARRREEKIQRLIWTFEVEGITLTREQAENAVDSALTKPLPDICE